MFLSEGVRCVLKASFEGLGRGGCISLARGMSFGSGAEAGTSSTLGKEEKGVVAAG